MRTRPLIASILILFAAGCAQAPVVFRPEARPLNRIYSGYELLTELNNQAALARDNGFISQQTIDTTIGPALDNARKTFQQAEAIYKLNPTSQPADFQSKLELATAITKSLRDQLAAINRGRK
jgi:hypothetical protein